MGAPTTTVAPADVADDFNAKMDAIAAAHASTTLHTTSLANNVLAAANNIQSEAAVLKTLAGAPDSQIYGIATRIMVATGKLVTNADAAITGAAASIKAFEVAHAGIHAGPGALVGHPAASWVANTDVVAKSTVVLPNGVIVFSDTGGKTGATAPTGAGLDGSVTWVAPVAHGLFGQPAGTNPLAA